MPDELEVKRRMTTFNLTARQIHLSHTNVDGNPENQQAPPLPITRDIPAGYVPVFQSARAGLCGDATSTAVKVSHLESHVERPKSTPANPTNSFVDQSVQLSASCHQAKVESSAQPAVHHPQSYTTVPTEATETKRSDRVMTRPQFKLTPANLTCAYRSVPLAPPASVESPAQQAVRSRSESYAPVPMEIGPIATGIKRKRLGMGRSGAGYTNKKFKVPAPP